MCLNELAFFKPPLLVVLVTGTGTTLGDACGYEILVTLGEADADEFGEPEEFVVDPFKMPRLLP